MLEYESYFNVALNFFHESQWIFNTPVTEILHKKCLDNFPDGWLEILLNLENEELNDFVAEKKYEKNWPRSLVTFIEKCKEIDRLAKPEPEPNLQLPSLFLRGLTPKKQHEILHLTHLVHRQCLEENISTIVDFGAGLGYVCQLLHHFYGYKILGLESSAQNVKTARQRQKTLYPNSMSDVKYSQFEVSEFSVNAIQEKLRQEFDDDDSSIVNGKICLIGLHACADLSVWIMKIFTQLENARLLILISCCYHKLTMSRIPGSGEFFESFPLSSTLKNVVQSLDLNCDFLRRTFLRLACQESAERWRGMSLKSHENHAFHVIARGVLELFAYKNQLRLTKLVQKGTRKSQCENFPMYLKDSLKRYEFVAVGENDLPANLEEEVTKLWTENEGKLKIAEIYTGLQLLLQSPAESLIIEDRIVWLRERGFNAEIRPVMEKSLSPRSHAIVSKKNKKSPS